MSSLGQAVSGLLSRPGYFPDRREIQEFRRYPCAPMLQAVLVLAAAVADVFRPRGSLLTEIALLRHQLAHTAALGRQAARDAVRPDHLGRARWRHADLEERAAYRSTRNAASLAPRRLQGSLAVAEPNTTRIAPRSRDLSWLLASSSARSLRIRCGTSLDDRVRIRLNRTVIRFLGSGLAAAVARLAARAMSAIHDACRPSGVAGGLIADLTRSRAELIAENVLLRQQLIVASRGVKRPGFRGHERGLLVLLARLLPRWRDALLLVKPETVLRWHRAGFRLFWRRKSRSAGSREPRLAPDVIALIKRMATENRLWGAGAFVANS